MNLYRDNDRFSLEPSFDLMYDGKRLMSEAELLAVKRYLAGEDVAQSQLSAIDSRFRAVTGMPALAEGAHAVTSECRNAISIFEIKAHLSREQLVHRWKSPSVAADSIVFENGRVLVVRRKKDPYRDYFALPGGILDEDETLEECAVRELREETGLRGEVVGLLDVFSDPKRDPRVRMVSAVFVVRSTGGNLEAGDDASDAAFVAIGSLPHLAYDHDRAIREFRDSVYFKGRE